MPVPQMQNYINLIPRDKYRVQNIIDTDLESSAEVFNLDTGVGVFVGARYTNAAKQVAFFQFNCVNKAGIATDYFKTNDWNNWQATMTNLNILEL